MSRTPKMSEIAPGSPYRQLNNYGQGEEAVPQQSYSQSSSVPQSNLYTQQQRQQQVPVPMQTAPVVPLQQAFVDKPADQRLAPWIRIASILLGLFAICCIIFTFVDEGRARTLWALLVTGILLLPVALLGLRSGISRNHIHARHFFYAFVAAFIISLILLIINASRLDVYMDRHCDDRNTTDLINSTVVDVNNNGGYTFLDTNNNNRTITNDCQDFREYHALTFATLGTFFATWVPSFLIASYFFYRLCKLYNKPAAYVYTDRPMGQVYNNNINGNVAAQQRY